MAVAAAMAAFSCCDAAWIVVRAAAKSDGATPEAADVMVMVSGSMGSGVAMVGRWAIEEEQLGDLYCRRAAGPA
jgi:hypothetical protein